MAKKGLKFAIEGIIDMLDSCGYVIIFLDDC